MSDPHFSEGATEALRSRGAAGSGARASTPPPAVIRSPALARGLRELSRQLGEGRKVLVSTSPRLLNLVSLYVVCSLQREPGTVLFISVDRPKGFMSRMVERHCPANGRVLWGDFTTLPQGTVSYVSGLFAPKLLLEAHDHLLRNAGQGVSVVVANLSALSYYNSNDRVREFLAALDKKVEEGPIRKMAIVMDGQEQYIYNEAKIFTDKSVELGW